MKENEQGTRRHAAVTDHSDTYTCQILATANTMSISHGLNLVIHGNTRGKYEESCDFYVKL
jgi:hypothetical protein